MANLCGLFIINYVVNKDKRTSAMVSNVCLFEKDADSNERFYIGMYGGINLTYFTAHFTMHKTNRSPASMQNKYN